MERGDQLDVGQETLLGRLLSVELEEPVYSIEGVEAFPYVSRLVKGERKREDQEPEDLVRALGCVLPWFDEPPLEPLTKPTRTAGLIQGLSATRVLHAFAQKEGRQLPNGYCHIEESSLGLLVREGIGWLGAALNNLGFRFPRATIYSVTASPGLEFFSVFLMRDRKIVEFVPPPEEATSFPAVHEVMGEREPERILAALGIPKEWFKL